MTSVTTEEAATEAQVGVVLNRDRSTAHATIIDHEPWWKGPAIPVFAGITARSCVQDDGFARWFHRPGEVVLGVWYVRYPGGVEEAEEVTFATRAPAIEVALPVKEHAALLLGIMAAGGATLAVLEFMDELSSPPTWATRWVEAGNLGKLVQLALGQTL